MKCNGLDYVTEMGGAQRGRGHGPSRPARGYGGALEAPPSGSGAEPQKLCKALHAIRAILMFKSHTKFDYFS